MNRQTNLSNQPEYYPVSEEDNIDYGKYARNNRNNENCMKFTKWDGPLYQNTNLINDKCLESTDFKQSTFPGNYSLNNYHACDCDTKELLEFATENPYMNFRDGYGVSECNINNSSQLRIGKTRKNPKCKSQLFHRPYLTIPYMGRGSGNSVVETQLKPGEDTSSKRQCNVLSGVNIKNHFTPLVKNLEDNIQNPDYLIQENADDKWVRGGIPSRQIVKDIDYMERCQKNDKGIQNSQINHTNLVNF